MLMFNTTSNLQSSNRKTNFSACFILLAEDNAVPAKQCVESVISKKCNGDCHIQIQMIVFYWLLQLILCDQN